jgi:hypothetical protein
MIRKIDDVVEAQWKAYVGDLRKVMDSKNAFGERTISYMVEILSKYDGIDQYDSLRFAV